MLVQLEETERFSTLPIRQKHVLFRSFDAFWERHERRLMHCLQLRQFEDSFRKVKTEDFNLFQKKIQLQAAFARHMMYLEEHREVGDGPERAELLAKQHDEYSQTAQVLIFEMVAESAFPLQMARVKYNFRKMWRRLELFVKLERN